LSLILWVFFQLYFTIHVLAASLTEAVNVTEFSSLVLYVLPPKISSPKGYCYFVTSVFRYLFKRARRVMFETPACRADNFPALDHYIHYACCILSTNVVRLSLFLDKLPSRDVLTSDPLLSQSALFDRFVVRLETGRCCFSMAHLITSQAKALGVYSK
jgi:hypothetical protein